MPRSKVRPKVNQRNAHRINDRAIKKAERKQRGWRQRLAVPLIIIGAVLFIGGQIGARTGLVSLPFDDHHLFAQWGGALIAFTGLMWLR